jgi:hypothetical protein
MAKPKTKRGDPKSDFFRLDEDKEWDTMKAQIMAKIDSILQPVTISYDDYDITFAIPRYSPQPMLLDDNDKYLYMVEHALKAKSGPCVKIVIEARVLEKKVRLLWTCDTRDDVSPLLQQKLGKGDKENITEFLDSEESDDEGEKRKKKRGKGSKVSTCIHFIVHALSCFFRFQTPSRYYLATRR